MKQRLMDILVCPCCKSSFSLNATEVEQRQYSPEAKEHVRATYAAKPEANPHGGFEALWATYCTEIVSGELSCETCDVTYSIVGGIPRILTNELKTIAAEMGRGNPTTDERLDREMDDIAPVAKDQDEALFQKIQKANQSNYGYEWQAFSHEYDQWEEVYESNYVKEDNAFFQGKLGLDAGCGMARYTRVSVGKGAEMVGLDLSNAIEAAYERGKALPMFHAVQGDIFNLPFRSEYFDFAQSLGVIHITPDPESALQSIKRVVQPGRNIFLMVYQTFEEESTIKHLMLKVVNPLRKLKVRMPSNVWYAFLYLLIPVVFFGCYLPSLVLWYLPGCRGLSSKLPYNYEQYSKRRLRDMHMNLFDRFGNPVERRYTRQQMNDWIGGAGFDHYELWSKDGWMVTCVKAGQAAASRAA